MPESSRYEQGKHIVKTESAQGFSLDMRLQLTLLEAMRKWVMRMFNRTEAIESIAGAIDGYREAMEYAVLYDRYLRDVVRSTLSSLDAGMINIKEAEEHIRMRASGKKVNNEKLDGDSPVSGSGGDSAGDREPSGSA